MVQLFKLKIEKRRKVLVFGVAHHAPSKPVHVHIAGAGLLTSDGGEVLGRLPNLSIKIKLN